MSSAVAVRPQPRAWAAKLAGPSLALLILAAGLLAVNAIFPRNFSFYRAPWLLHPFEQEHLTIARNLAHGHGLTISDPTLDPAYGSEDKGYVDGRFVPRSVLVPYLVYAPSFLISDTAWLYVTPLFSVLAAAACFAIVFRRTGSMIASAGAPAVFLLAAPVLLASTGIAYESMIALAFLLWGAFFAEQFHRQPGLTSGALAGLMFACAANSRADYAPAGLVFLTLASGWPLYLRLRHGVSIYPRLLIGVLIATALIAGGIACILATNYAFTGNPLQSAYGPNAWFSTPEGVGHGLLTFRPHDFVLQARLFLWEIAKPTLPLLSLSVAAILTRREVRWGDIILLTFSAFLIVFHLERTGSHGSTEPVLVASPPRYILPVYATAAVCGLTALHSLLTAERSLLQARLVLLGSVAAVMACLGLREAFTNRTSLPVIGVSLEQQRAAHDFSERHPDALFVGDIYTKGIIISERTLIPRLTDPEYVVALVKGEIVRGRAVYVTDSWPDVAKGPYYSGYAEQLQAAGLVLCPQETGRLAVQRLVDPNRQAPDAHSLQLPATGANGLDVSLEPGKEYFVISRGSFVNSQSGGVSQANYFWIDGQALKGLAGEESVFCGRFHAESAAANFAVADKVYSDNHGGLQITLIEAEP